MTFSVAPSLAFALLYLSSFHASPVAIMARARGEDNEALALRKNGERKGEELLIKNSL